MEVSEYVRLALLLNEPEADDSARAARDVQGRLLRRCGPPRPPRYDPPMRRADVLAATTPHRDEILRRFGVRSLMLFGSVARDEAGPDSDVDFLVEFDGPTTFDAHMGLATYLEDLLGHRVDVITTTGLKPRLRALIQPDLHRVA